MQTDALFFREIETPLGLAILAANPIGLAGFYFSDQRDCPIQFPISNLQKINRPQAGEHQGTTLRRLKVSPSQGHINGSGWHNLYKDINWGRGVREVTPSPGSPTNRQFKCDGQAPRAVSLVFEHAIAELDAYFRGQLMRFSVPLSFSGTNFQMKIWHALASLPSNKLTSYGELGRVAGVTPGAYRAVGVAVGRNPLSIIVPCHRVVASNAQLTGYGGGLKRKVALLEHEGFKVS